jgi:hypothetical protein
MTARLLKAAGFGIAIAGLLMCPVGFLAWFGNALTMEARSDSLSLLANLFMLAGIVLVWAGGLLAVIGGMSSARDEPWRNGTEGTQDRILFLSLGRTGTESCPTPPESRAPLRLPESTGKIANSREVFGD